MYGKKLFTIEQLTGIKPDTFKNDPIMKKEKEKVNKVKFIEKSCGAGTYLIPDLPNANDENTAINYNKGGNILIIGSTNSGKSTFICNILNRLEDVETVYIMSSTIEFDNDLYQTILLKRKIKYKIVDFSDLPEIIANAENALEEHKNDKKKDKKYSLPVLLLDDVQDRLRKNKIFDSLITYSRKIFHSLILAIQTHTQIDAVIWRNCRTICISSNLPLGELDSVLDKVTAEIDKKRLEKIINDNKRPHNFIVVNLQKNKIFNLLDDEIITPE